MTQPHWMHQDDRTNMRVGQIGGRTTNSVWCGQNVDWVTLPGSNPERGGNWTVVTIPPNLDPQVGDQVRLERVGDTWMVTLILRSATPATTTTTTTTTGGQT